MTGSAVAPVSKLQELIYELEVEQVMRRDVITVTPQTTLQDFKELLRLKRISGTPVVEGGELVGIISLEDLIGALERGDMEGCVGQMMTRQVETISLGEPVLQAVNRFARLGYGRLPVVDRSGQLVGILTRADIIRGLLHRLEVDYLREEKHRHRASYIFEDIVSDRTSLLLRYQIEPLDFSQSGAASSKIKRAMERLGGRPPICRRVGVAAYEAEMNLVIHTQRGGELLIEMQPDQVHLVAADDGPGIPDVAAALCPGFSTAPEWIREMGFGAGMGLQNIQRCADDFRLDSQAGMGTRLEAWFRIPPSPAAPPPGEEGDLL